MTIRHFNEAGIVSEEHYFEKNKATGELIKIASWHFNGQTLTVTQYRNRDKNGNYYKTERTCTDTSYWQVNKRKELLQ